MTARDTLFISHANPEDNDFARWLTLRLAREGYRVWCDLTQLLGGEAFWSNIEAALRTRALKVLFVLSKTSNVKRGPEKELRLALTIQRQENLRDFIIPLKIDDLAHSQTKIDLHDIDAVPFTDSWARGLAILLEKLERDGVPRDPAFSVNAVATWWRDQYLRDELRSEPQFHTSTWLPIVSLPKRIFVHQLVGATIEAPPDNNDQGPSLFPAFATTPASQTAPIALPAYHEFRHPVVRRKSTLVTFDPKPRPKDATGFSITSTHELPLDGFLTAGFEGMPQLQARHAVTELLDVAWKRLMRSRGLRGKMLADESVVFVFPLGRTDDDKVWFGSGDRRKWRNVVGKRGTAYWHFGLAARPVLGDEPRFNVSPHVLFSDDGSTIWESDARLQRARAGLSRRWWNPEWRDRMLGTLAFLGPRGVIALPLGPKATAQITAQPDRFESPVAYDDPAKPEEFETSDEDEETVSEEAVEA